jgi:hypothetical protein
VSWRKTQGKELVVCFSRLFRAFPAHGKHASSSSECIPNTVRLPTLSSAKGSNTKHDTNTFSGTRQTCILR